MMSATLVYSPQYFADIGMHVFQVRKYHGVFRQLLADGSASEDDVLKPTPANDEQLRLVHTPEYVADLNGHSHSPRTRQSELPFSRSIIDAFRLATGGTIDASRAALAQGRAINLAGGFHHAFADRAEGFCYMNDIAIAIAVMRHESRIQRAFVLDLDLHQGNGTAAIFAQQPAVFTFSMHQERLYPPKETGDFDLGLENGIDDDAYLERLAKHAPELIKKHQPDLLVYVAGVDPFQHDQLGSLALTTDGLKARDEWVVDECTRQHIPVVAVLAGGYAKDPQDTIDLHSNTCRAFLGP